MGSLPGTAGTCGDGPLAAQTTAWREPPSYPARALSAGKSTAGGASYTPGTATQSKRNAETQESQLAVREYKNAQRCRQAPNFPQAARGRMLRHPQPMECRHRTLFPASWFQGA